ncbi:MAG: HEAT repeat domain-containing protein [Methylocella sp.]
MRYQFLAIAFLASYVTAQPAQAMPVGSPDVPEMAQASDLIVVGRASLTQNTPFLVTVDRVLKGGTGTSRRLLVLPAQASQDYPYFPSVQERQYGIFFLRRQPGGSTYTVTDPFHPALAASPRQAPNQPASADVLGGVAQELTSVLTAPAATLTDPVNGVQHLITAAPVDQAQYVYYEAASALKSIPYAVAGPALDTIAASNQVPAHLWAMYSLFLMPDSDDDDSAKDDEDRAKDDEDSAKMDYLQSVTPILVNPGPDLAFSASWLGIAIDGHLKSPAAVPALAVLLGSTQVAVRRAAASDLCEIATPDVVAPLAKVAINDSDERVLYRAVYGLAVTTGAAKAPSVPTFRQKQDEILHFWRSWARANVRGP